MLNSRHFGAIDDSEDYAAVKPWRRAGMRIDVNVDKPAAFSQAAIDAVDRALDAIDALEAAAREAFTAVLADDSSQPAQFWQFYRDEVEGFASLAREDFVARLELVRAGCYPAGDAGGKVVLDFKLPGIETDQILVANLAFDGALLGIAWES